MIAMPKKIGGKSEGGEGPSVTVISMKPKMPKRIGGITEEEEPEGDEESLDSSSIKKKSAGEMLAAIKDSDSGRFAKALEAFCRAVDSEPHEEGEHNDETESE